MPLVTVGMPVFNGEAYIAAAIDSLLAQDHSQLELIVSDNASTDNTPAICKARAALDPRIKYHRNPENLGPTVNFNWVLESAHGDYFMWAAADDLWEPGFVSTLLAKLQSNPGAVLAFSAFDNIDERGEHLRAFPHLGELLSGEQCPRLLNYMLHDERLGKANLIYGLMRRTAIQSIGGLTLRGRGDWGADMLMVFRLLATGAFMFTDELLFHKRLVSDPAAKAPQVRSTVPIALGRMRALRTSLLERREYFLGYRAIIDTPDLVSMADQRILRAALRHRASRFYVSELVRQIIRPVIRKLA